MLVSSLSETFVLEKKRICGKQGSLRTKAIAGILRPGCGLWELSLYSFYMGSLTPTATAALSSGGKPRAGLEGCHFFLMGGLRSEVNIKPTEHRASIQPREAGACLPPLLSRGQEEGPRDF